MLARVKQDYTAGPVMAFSGREYVRSEWREVPAGFEEQAKSHPLLETQPSLDEIRAANPMLPGLGNVTAVTEEPQAEEPPAEPPTEETPAEEAPTETPSEEPPAEEPKPKHARRRRRAAEE